MPRRFDKEFKQNAVNLILEKKLSISRVSKDLDERLRKLEREMEVLRRERELLKKTLAIFSSP